MDLALTMQYMGFDSYTGSVVGNSREEYDALEWPENVTPPTWEELKAAWPEAKKANYTLYRRGRYPAITDGLDAFVKYIEAKRCAGEAVPGEIADYVDACLEVKAAYPKPDPV